jgi:hypothetical protein
MVDVGVDSKRLSDQGMKLNLQLAFQVVSLFSKGHTSALRVEIAPSS